MQKNPQSAPQSNLRFAVLATDVALFTIHENALKILLIQVNLPPHFVNARGVPGGLILAHETADDSITRHLRDKVGVTVAYFEQLYTFSALSRDPRNRVVSVAYLAIAPSDVVEKTKTNPKVGWVPVTALPKLAYDHNEIVAKALERLRGKMEYTTIARGFLPKTFTLSELQKVYEIVLGKPFDKRNFRKKILALKIVKKTGSTRSGGAYRPAELFSFSVPQNKIFEIL